MTARKTNYLAFAPFAAFAVCVVLFALPLLEGRDPAIIPSALIGKPAPAHELPPALDALPGLSAASYKNLKDPVLVNVFASWCVTCRAEQQTLQELAATQKVKIFGIDYKDTRVAVAAWLKQTGNPYAAIGFDETGRASIDWGVYGVPETYVVDKTGVIRYKYVGAIVPQDIEKIFKPLLAELRK